jgi:hypothetical protein
MAAAGQPAHLAELLRVWSLPDPHRRSMIGRVVERAVNSAHDVVAVSRGMM